jgi:hypothetical protein
MSNFAKGARWATAVSVVVTAAVGGLAARPARACGGFFCNQPQSPTDLPVAQTAENVLFAMDRDPASGQFKLEAHVQIFYTGPADKFSWVVPVDSAPTLGVGGNAVFNALLAATQPRYSLEWKTEGTCKAHEFPPPSNRGAGGSSASGTGGSSGSPGGVTIAFRGDVGPYDAAVLRSNNPGDAGPLLQWLATNQYFVTPEGMRLIRDYVQQDKHFVAIKLQPQKGISEIQPLVMRFLGPGPCVPLKLTAIAALKDLRINLWVLADHRVVPENFFEIELNPAAIDWFSGGANRDELLKRAANEAGGNAFATDYAGSTSALQFALYRPGQYDLTSIRAAQSPPDALDAIAGQAFARDSSLLLVLRTHIPLPPQLAAMGVDERTFYNQLRSYWQSNRDWFAPFDAGKLADDLDSKLVAPARDAQALLDGHTKLTRLSTFISPEEMTSDPTFLMNPSLPDVPLEHNATAVLSCGDQQHSECSAPVRLELPDGQAVWFRPRDPQAACYNFSAAYDRGILDQQALLYGWKRSSDGAGLLKFDQTKVIAAAVAAHNRGDTTPTPRPGGTGGTGGAGVAPSSGDGCGCILGAAAPASPWSWTLILSALGLVLAARRRFSAARRRR